MNQKPEILTQMGGDDMINKNNQEEIELILCPICEEDRSTIWAKEYKGNIIVKCNTCGLRYVNPRRKSEVNFDIYSHDYFHGMQIYEQDVENLGYLFKQTLTLATRILSYTHVEDPRFLDVGTGTGFILKVLKLMGYNQLTGTDLQNVNEAGLSSFNIPLLVGELQNLHLEEYDVITAYHVLEHVMEPNVFLKAMRLCLAKNGVLHIILPNESSLISLFKSFMSRYRLKKKPYKHLSPGHHLYFYNLGTLEKLLRNNGFSILYIGTRANNKPKNLINSFWQAILTRTNMNTWIEVVACKS